ATSQGDPTVFDSIDVTTTAYAPFANFFEDFEGCVSPDLPEKWSKIVESTSTYPYVKSYSSGTYAHSGTMMVKFYNSSDISAELLLITPALASGSAGNKLNFWARSGGTQNFIVGTIADPTDASTFTPIDTFEVTTTYAEYEYTVNFAKGTGYVAWKHANDGTYDSDYIDDISWVEILPYNVAVNQLTPNAEVRAGTSYNYFIEIENVGTNNDTYDLASAGGSWTYEIRDKDDIGTISTLPVNAGEKDTCIVKVTVPSGASFGDTDTETFTATSQGDPTISDNCSITTTALPEEMVQIGQGTETNKHLPMECFYGYTYSQSIFLQSEINIADQRISTLYYHYNGNSAWTDDIVVYIGHTNLTTFDNSSAWVPFLGRNLVEVYSGPMSVPSVDSWIEIVFDSPFNYNNVDNLVIAFDENTSGYHSSSDEFYCTSTDPLSRSIYYYNDNINPDPTDPPDGTTSTYRPNVRLLFEEIPPVPVMTLSDSTYDFGWVEEGATPSWDVSITNSGSVDLIISDVTINPPFSCVYPDTILPGNTEVATIYLDASNPGIFDDVLTFNSNAIGGNTIDLSAIVYGADYFTEGFEDLEFPPFGWINDDGYWHRYSANAYSGDGFARCSWAHICDACLISPRLIIESGDFISFYWINANLYGKGGGKVEGADTTFFEITGNLCNDNWETLAILAPEEEMTEYDHVIILIPEDYVGNMARVRWRHKTELSVDSRGAGVDEVMLPPLYHPVNFYLDPVYQSDYDAVETTVEYPVDVYNTGVQPDRYFISILNSRSTRDVEDFEATDGGYVGTGEWQWGIPTSGPGNAHSGVNVWATNLSGDYMDNANYTLDSPEVEIVGSTFTFWHYYDIESYWDGGNIKISTDGGATWALIVPEGGYPGTAYGLNDEPAFNGNSGGWIEAVFDIADYVGETVSFRWHFGSDGSITYPGWYIDDVDIPGNGGPGPPPVGWPATVSEDYLDIIPGEFGTFSVFVDIPEDAGEDDVNVTTVYVESRDNPDVNHTSDAKTTCHPKDPYEPNDNFADATPIAYGFVSEGAQIYYNPDYDDEDVDIYTFDGLEGDVVYTLFDVADTLLFDGAIVLLDADSIMLAYADSYAGGVSEALQYRLQNDGTFYLMLGEWSDVTEGPFKKTVLRTQTTTYYTMSLELIPSPGVLVEPPELTLGIIQNGKDTASDILYITNTGDEGAINLDWDIEVVIPGIDIFLDEGFDNFPPDGWTAEPNWAGYNSSYAGGTPPEARFGWSPSFTGIGRLISPVINTSGYTILPLSFKHFVNDYSGGYTLGVATTSDGGTTWNDVWTISPTGNVGPETIALTLENADVGSETFQVCWYFDGYTFNIDYWYVDDVRMATGEPWVWADPVAGSVPQGATRTSTITCDDATLEPGVHEATIIVHNNALLYGVSDVNVLLTLNVLPAAGGLQGHVIFSTTGEPIDSVKVSAGNFVAYTDTNGFYQFDAIAQGLYNIKYERSGFLDHWEYDIPLGPWVVVLDVEMIFDGPPPTDLEAEGKPYCIDLTWHAPTTGGVTQVEYVLDDGSYENGWTGNPGYELWFGNLFPVDDIGELISFDLYTEFNASAGSDLLEIDIFDAAHNLVGSSESFVPIADTWTTISCPNVPFDGEFYALIHYNYESAQSNWIGYDENGPNANANLDWYTDGTIWQLFHTAAGTVPGVFMLRATAMVQGELTEITVGDIDYTQTVLPKDQIASIGKTISEDNPIYNPNPGLNYGELDSYEITINRDDLVLDGYNVYRVDEGFLDFVPVEDPRYYRDEIVAVGIEYTYWVTAVYTVGESGPSNYASAIPEAPGGWEDDFDIDWHLTGWTLVPPSPNNWTWSPGYAMLNWSPSVTNYDMSLISPTIVIPDDPINVYDILVSMYINDYSTDTGETMEIWIIHDGVETMIFEWDLDVNDNWGVSGGEDWVYTDTGQFAGETVQFKFRSHGGDTYNFNQWYVYYVSFDYLGIPPDYGALQGIVTDGWGVGIEDAELTVIGDLHPLGRYVVTTNDTGYYEIDPIIAQEYDLTCVATGFTTYTAEFEVLPDETLVWDIIMGNPTIDVTPPFVTITLDPNTQGTEFLTVSNDGNAPLGWY
ncbi:MAG: immune inhibitor A, partial [Candidatus Cloacimonetes bacterium]|nr:immune inhibitor A [Candidatus Cloacimonadota bacterium]